MIEVSALTKIYGEHRALDNVSFKIEPGHIYGLLGPNGAGKTTTMNIITGCLAATSGTVTIDGHDIFEQPLAAKKLVGYLPEQPPLYQDMTPYEYLKFVAEAKGVERWKIEGQLEFVKSAAHLDAVWDRLIRNLSKGYKQRVGIASALLGDPTYVILDEPTVGLDPKQIIEIRELITSLAGKCTVILSSHILSEVQAVCEKILIISHGKLVAFDTPENLERDLAGNVTVELTAKTDESGISDLLAEFGEFTVTSTDGEYINVELSASSDCREAIFFAFARAGIAIIRMELRKFNLEDIFLELTDDSKESDDQSSVDEPAVSAELEFPQKSDEKEDAE